MRGFAHPGLYALITASLPLQASAGRPYRPHPPCRPSGRDLKRRSSPPGWRTTAVAPCAPLPTGSFRMAFAGVWSCFYGGEINFRKKIPCHIKRNLLTFVEQKWNASYQWTGQRLRMPYPRIARYGTSRQGFATSGRSGSYIRWTRQPPGGAIRFKELRRATPDLSQKMPTAAPEDTRRGRLCHPHRMPGSPAEGRICAARPGTSAASAHRRPDRVGTGK